MAGSWLAVLGLLLAAAEPEEGDWADINGPPDPIAGCEEALEAQGIRFREARIPLHQAPGGSITCGAEQVVRFVKGTRGIRWSTSPKLTCGLALALAKFEDIVQEEAKRHLGTAVVRIDHVGTYNCREMAAYPGWVSEHAYANAIDLRAFILRGGREIKIGRHYGRGVEGPETREGAFLRAVARRAYDDEVFSVVLTPAFDRAHRGHFHFDLARYRVDGTRPE